MKNIVIFDCGPSLTEVSKKFGSAPEWIIEMLQNQGCRFKWVKSYKGETINHQEGDAWIITGSPKSVYDEMDWMLDLEEKVRGAQKHSKPVLGICFGHQLIAKSFGGRVEKNPNGWELGSYTINLTDTGENSPLFNNMDDKLIVYESHQDSVTLMPDGADILAYSKKCVQAFRLHEVLYGVQFHPEFSWNVIKKYVSVRSAEGVHVDNPIVAESLQSYLVLYNFIGLI